MSVKSVNSFICNAMWGDESLQIVKWFRIKGKVVSTYSEEWRYKQKIVDLYVLLGEIKILYELILNKLK